MMERMYNERSKFKIQMLETQKLYEKEKNPTERIKISKEVQGLTICKWRERFNLILHMVLWVINIFVFF